MNRNVSILEITKGKKIAVINNIRFTGKRLVHWDDVKEYLKAYVGKSYRVEETNDIIYIGNDLPVYGPNEKIERFNVFHASLLVRHDENGRMYLYDIMDIKKKQATRLNHKSCTRHKTRFSLL